MFSASAEPILLPAKADLDLNITNQIQYLFADPDKNVQEVSELDDASWQKMSERGGSLGFHKDALWLKFSVSSTSARSLFLVLDYAINDYVDLYAIGHGRVDKFSTGDRIPIEQRWLTHRKLVLPIELNANQTQNYYLRVFGKSSYTVPLLIYDKNTFYEKDSAQTLFYGGLFGAGVVMIFFNLLLGIALRQSAYLFYVLFTLSFTMFGFTLEGFARFYFWTSTPVFSDMSLVLWGQIGGISYALFLTRFLPLKTDYFKHYQACIAHACAMAVLLVLSLVGFSDYMQIPTHFLNAVFALYSMYLTFVVWRRGFLAAKFVFWGWSFLMVAVVIKVLLAGGFLPFNNVLFHTFDLGMSLNFVLLAFALSYQMVEAKKSQLAAKQDADHAKHFALLNLENYRALFEYAPIPMFKINADDYFVNANEAFLKLFGFKTEQELIDARIKSKTFYKYKQDYQEVFDRLSKGETRVDKEIEVVNLAGTMRWLRMSVRLYEEHGQTLFEGACMDITHLKLQREQELESHKREVNQLEALVSGFAHYLNTPIGTASTAETVISGETREINSAFQQKSLTPSKLKSFLEKLQNSAGVIRSSLEKSVNVIGRFRELKPHESAPAIDKVDSTEFAKNIQLVMFHEETVEMGLDIEDNIHQELSIPQKQLLVVLEKLCRNSLEHGAASSVNINLSKENDKLHIVLQDNGSGLDSEIDPNNLFAPFTAKSLSMQDVSGLDLFFVKTVIQNRLGGSVTIRKNALPKLIFDIYVPLTWKAQD